MLRQTFEETMDQLLLLIRAGCPVIYIVSHEETRVMKCLARVVRVVKSERRAKNLFQWTAGAPLTGFRNLSPAPKPIAVAAWLSMSGLEGSTPKVHGNELATEALSAIVRASTIEFGEARDCVSVFFDVHPHLKVDAASGAGGTFVRPLRQAAAELRMQFDHQPAGDRCSKTIVIVAPSDTGLSPELDRDLIKIRFPLPERDELLAALDHMLDDGHLKYEPGTDRAEESRLREAIAGAGCGLTLDDYKLGLNKIVARGQGLSRQRVDDMAELKATVISNQALTYTPRVEIELGGLQEIKDWLRVRRDAAVSVDVRNRFNLPPPRGVLLCGASGGGKSMLAKLIAKELDLALLRLDVGSLFGAYVGESEHRTREALELAEALAPVVLWIDEIDKAFKGIGAGGDNGISARVFGFLLTWLSEKQDSVFVVATANDHQALIGAYPEFGRRGRFDRIFWVGLPTPAEREAIIKIYLEKVRKATGGLQLDVDANEIRELCEETGIAVESSTDGFDLLCKCLSVDGTSGQMTGAEIEAAITAAKYRISDSAAGRTGGMPGSLTPRLLMEVLESEKEQAVYAVGTDARARFDAAQRDAIGRGWFVAPNLGP